ncbi:hypothetical protein J437_LFUL010477 [Ladona fulva]|uniref:Uncharacterized protein n=1 Tax=Ladona fulva TaxID=123851 RepID=A0A8K0P8W9_LADFU|nr:hypothetical protein J437_LFUL010477 [Ladona fulva]
MEILGGDQLGPREARTHYRINMLQLSTKKTFQSLKLKKLCKLKKLINQLQNSNPFSNPEALQWTAEADDSLARNEILADDEIIRMATAEDDDDDDDTPVNSVKFLILRLWRHSIPQYSRLKSNILKHTKLCSSDKGGILRLLNVPNTPQQNSVAERKNSTLVDVLLTDSVGTEREVLG